MRRTRAKQRQRRHINFENCIDARCRMSAVRFECVCILLKTLHYIKYSIFEHFHFQALFTGARGVLNMDEHKSDAGCI